MRARATANVDRQLHSPPEHAGQQALCRRDLVVNRAATGRLCSTRSHRSPRIVARTRGFSELSSVRCTTWLSPERAPRTRRGARVPPIHSEGPPMTTRQRGCSIDDAYRLRSVRGSNPPSAHVERAHDGAEAPNRRFGRAALDGRVESNHVEPSPLGRPRGCGGVRGHRGGVRRRSTERLVIRHRAESGPLAHRETTLDSRLELFAQHPGCFVAAVDELEPWMSNSTRQAQRSPTDARLGMRSTAPRKDNLSCGFRGRRARASRGRPTKN